MISQKHVLMFVKGNRNERELPIVSQLWIDGCCIGNLHGLRIGSEVVSPLKLFQAWECRDA